MSFIVFFWRWWVGLGLGRQARRSVFLCWWVGLGSDRQARRAAAQNRGQGGKGRLGVLPINIFAWPLFRNPGENTFSLIPPGHGLRSRK